MAIYEPIHFAPGQTLTAEHMNHIQEGIVEFGEEADIATTAIQQLSERVTNIEEHGGSASPDEIVSDADFLNIFGVEV